MATTHRLSKSTFMRGLQCAKSLYLYRKRPDLQDDAPPGRQELFDRGIEVGRLARDLFPGGLDLSPDYVDGLPRFERAIGRTQEAIRAGAPVIYEAAFVHEGVLAAVDIMVRDGARWRAYEVKSGASVKDTYVTDAALQHWVLGGAGIDLEDLSIAHIDTSYVRLGGIDVKRLFAVVSVLERAAAQRDDVGYEVGRLLRILAGRKEPEVDIGPHCAEPYPCSFTGHCWSSVPERSVFELSRFRDRAWQLYRQGIVELADIPDDFPLSDKQRIELDCARTGLPHVDTEAVRAFVKSLGDELFFLDFETMSPAVPLLEGTSPYQAIPFQYSLHRRASRGGELTHREYLGDGRGDPREGLVAQLLEDAAGAGRIAVYTGFERTQLENLARAFPDRAAGLHSLVERLVDLSAVFFSHSYYAAAMGGSCSIKTVLPALVPDLSYDGMELADGQAASGAYERLHTGTDPDEAARIRRALLAYCGLDTLAMVRLLEVLERV